MTRLPSTCRDCGYVVGATCGYDPLTAEERGFLAGHDVEVSKNVRGEEIARRASTKEHWTTARYVLHKLRCERPTRFERVA